MLEYRRFIHRGARLLLAPLCALALKRSSTVYAIDTNNAKTTLYHILLA